MEKPKLTFWEIVFEGIKKFAGELIGVVLIASFLWFFPSLKSLFTEHSFPQKDEPQAEIHRELESRQEEERQREELKRREEALRAAEAKKAEEPLRAAEAKKAEEAAQKSEAPKVKADTAEAVKIQQEEHAQEAAEQAKQKSGAELLREVLESYGPEDFFSAELNPKIFYDEKTKKPYVQITEKFNQSVFWNEFIPKLHKVLDSIAAKKEKHFYTNDVRKANQTLMKSGYIIGGGVYWHHYHQELWGASLPYTVIPFSWVSDEESRYTEDSDSGVYPYEYLFDLASRWNRKEGILPERTSWKAVIPNDNASFTIYTLPVEFIRYQPDIATAPVEFDPYKIAGDKKRIKDYRKAINTVDFTDSLGLVPLWLDFIKKMSAQVSFSVTYLASNGNEINIQPIQAGSKYPVIYRSIFHDEGFYGGYVYNKSDLFYLIPACMAVAPGYVSQNRHDLFLDTEKFNQKYGKGYTVELDPDELQRLDSMKFEVIFD